MSFFPLCFEEVLMGLVNQPDDGNQCKEPAKMTQFAL